jgi:hypothetical protein
MHYLKFQIPVGKLLNIITEKNYNRINFFIDLPSISRGFFNLDVVHLEINRYIEEQTVPVLFFDEARQFYNSIYQSFSRYNPRFITFYDDGKCVQNTNVDSAYKAVSTMKNLLLEDNELELFRTIKKYYWEYFPEHFEKQNLSNIIYLQEYEADFIPYFFLQNNLINCRDTNCFNIILSIDKDLTQCCEFSNVVQCATIYSKKDKQLVFNILDNENCISYFYKEFKRGFLTAKYVPLMLALSGDKADGIPGIPQIGPATAYKLILKYKLPPIIDQSVELPNELKPHLKQIMRNLKMISFEQQIERIPDRVKDTIRKYISFNKQVEPNFAV